MDWRDEILGIVDALRPRELLAVMPIEEPLWGRLTQSEGAVRCRRLSGAEVLAQALRTQRNDIAITAGALEHMRKREATAVIAVLRDLHAKALYAAVPLGARWPGLTTRFSNEDLIAYGLRPVRQYMEAGRPLGLYHYDIYDYKLTPDWLNSKHWANPHRWDKARW